MSSLSEQNPLNPQDPLHYAPRWLRERPEAARLSLVEEPREPAQAVERQAVERPAAERAAIERPVATTNSLDARLESAVFESLRHSLDPHVMRDPPEFTRERDRRSVAFKIAGRFAAAIGVAAVVALFFVNIVPVSRQPDASSSFVAAVQSMKTTPAAAPASLPVATPETKDARADQTQAKPDQADLKATPALSQFQALLASGEAAAQSPQTVKSESPEKPLLQQFMQWNQKAPQPNKIQ
jgi:hypothetical protein